MLLRCQFALLAAAIGAYIFYHSDDFIEQTEARWSFIEKTEADYEGNIFYLLIFPQIGIITFPVIPKMLDTLLPFLKSTPYNSKTKAVWLHLVYSAICFFAMIPIFILGSDYVLRAMGLENVFGWNLIIERDHVMAALNTIVWAGLMNITIHSFMSLIDGNEYGKILSMPLRFSFVVWSFVHWQVYGVEMNPVYLVAFCLDFPFTLVHVPTYLANPENWYHRLGVWKMLVAPVHVKHHGREDFYYKKMCLRLFYTIGYVCAFMPPRIFESLMHVRHDCALKTMLLQCYLLFDFGIVGGIFTIVHLHAGSTTTKLNYLKFQLLVAFLGCINITALGFHRIGILIGTRIAMLQCLDVSHDLVQHKDEKEA